VNIEGKLDQKDLIAMRLSRGERSPCSNPTNPSAKT